MRSAGVVFGAIAPHGTLAVPEACSAAERELAAATQAGMAELGRRFDAAAPDVTVLFTPHNVHVDLAFAVITAGRVEGSLAIWDAGLDHVRLSVPTDRELAEAVTDEIRSTSDGRCVKVSFGGNDAAGASMPMDWATLIPLWFMGGRREPPPPVVVVAPCRDFDAGAHVAAGRAVARAAERLGRRAAVIASADHGHGHREDGPYGYSPESKTYDERVANLVRGGQLAELESFAPAFVDAAKADSWWQMLMLHGALGTGWRPSLLAYEAPTYFGMLCAAFEAPPDGVSAKETL